MTNGKPAGVTRREWLRRAGAAGAVVVAVPVDGLAGPDGVARSPQGDPLETLTSDEAATLDAIVARLIPSDDQGPGAREARAARYIDRALGGALAASREAYRTGLSAIDDHARKVQGARFVDLSPAHQDDVLGDVERNVATGFVPSAAAFFSLVRTHTLQGTFGDPHYGGNESFVGWDLIGYPGVRLAVGPADQALDAKVTPVRRSAYDLGMFSPRPPRAGRRGRDGRHGD
jgi:gluconate 2-dehydrogenase gamma chain